MSFRSVVLNRTGVEFFINIILNIEETEILTVAWLSFLVGLIFISYSYLLTITVTVWPITPCSTVTWFIVITGAIWNFVGYYCWRRTFKFKRALNLTKGFKLWVYVFAIVSTLFIPYKLNPILMLLINCFKLLKSKCSIFKLKILGHVYNFDRKSVVQTESVVNKWMNRKKFIFSRVNSTFFRPEIKRYWAWIHANCYFTRICRILRPGLRILI